MGLSGFYKGFCVSVGNVANHCGVQNGYLLVTWVGWHSIAGKLGSSGALGQFGGRLNRAENVWLP